MSTTENDVLTQAKLDRIISGLQHLKANTPTDRIYHTLEIVRDQVSRLSHEHEAIRREIGELGSLIVQQSAATAD